MKVAMKNRRHSVLIALTLGGFLVANVGPASAQDDKDKDKDKAKAADPLEDSNLYNCGKAKGSFYVNFKPDVELKDLVDWAMGFSCKSFVWSSAIGTRTAKVTIMTPKRLTARQSWRVFLTALQSMGMAVVPKGNILEIVEQAKAKREPLPLYINGRPANDDQMVRVVLRPEHLGVSDLSSILMELKSAEGEVKAVPNAGIIVVTDSGTHVSKMAALMLEVDRPVVGERLFMIKVKHADATELVNKITDIVGIKPTTGAAPKSTAATRRRTKKLDKKKVSNKVANDAIASAIPSKLTADERINAIIVLGTKPAYLRVKALVDRLDFDLPSNSSGRIHVYPLEHADAEEMAQTLTSVISGIQAGTRTPARPGTTRPAPRPTGTNAGSTASSFEGDVRVSHDKPTNSLVVVASVADFNSLLRVIRILDSARRQVYIEATIVEVSVNRSRDFGVSFHGGYIDDGSGSIVLGGVQHSQLGSLNVQSLATATGAIGGILGPLLDGAEQFLGTSIPSFGVLFQALATAGNVHILSTPHIFTTDNEEAEISVGQNIPYQSAAIGGGFGGAGGAGGIVPSVSVQRQDVALTLKITPHVNIGGMVRLEIDLEISDIASEDFGGLGPSWSKRTIKDTVVVRDQQAVVIGGLMQDRKTSSESKVPLLGDIPILGSLLFKFKRNFTEKRNLLVMLTPYVVGDQLDIERIVEKRTREQAEFIRTFSAFASMKYRPDIDYRRKRGVLEEINRTARQIGRETVELEALEKRRITFPDGPIEYVPKDDDDTMDADAKEGEDGAKSGGE